MISGNIEGIRKSILTELQGIYDMSVPKYTFCTDEIIQIISKISMDIEREISVGIDRKGKIVSVSIGDSTSAEIPLLDINEKKLQGVRIIHTHPSGFSKLSALDISALIKLKLDAIMAIGISDKGVIDSSIGFCDVFNNELTFNELTNLSICDALNINILDKILYIEGLIKSNSIEEDNLEKAIIVGCDTRESLEELKELSSACDIPVLESVFQKKTKIDTAFYIGSGKVQEISRLKQTLRANLIIFDDELKGSQVRNLESVIGTKVIDRTTLILEIFARRAKAREAKIQVELAQLKYRLARLGGLGTVLSRTGGGIGTRGPGEKKLETDRRHIRESIFDLTQELKKIKKHREVQREKRTKLNIPRVSLVGYTNAGKSTLRNALCKIACDESNKGKDDVFEANMLFATLDTTTRAINLLDNRLITLTDTVGFVQKLPHELVEAFKSTLEEVIYSDLLCHVVDASSENAKEQIEAVEGVLTELGAIDKPTILVLNKVDLVSEEIIEELTLVNSKYKTIKISAKTGFNLEELLKTIASYLPSKLKTVEYVIPYTDQNMVAFLHRNASIEIEEYREEGTYIKASVDDEIYNKTVQFLIG